jgi:hypothetical protein
MDERPETGGLTGRVMGRDEKRKTHWCHSMTCLFSLLNALEKMTRPIGLPRYTSKK